VRHAKDGRENLEISQEADGPRNTTICSFGAASIGRSWCLAESRDIE
jgi:hypothetical protein